MTPEQTLKELDLISLERVEGSTCCLYSVIENDMAILSDNQEKILKAIKLIANLDSAGDNMKNEAIHLLSEGLNVWGEADWQVWKIEVLAAFPILRTKPSKTPANPAAVRPSQLHKARRHARSKNATWRRLSANHIQ